MSRSLGSYGGGVASSILDIDDNPDTKLSSWNIPWEVSKPGITSSHFQT